MALGSTLWIQAVVSWAMLTLPVFAPDAAGELGLEVGLIGVYAAIAYVGSMAGALLGGGFVARLGAVRLSQVCLVVCALSVAAFASGSWWVLALATLVLGVGYGPCTPASSHVLSRHTPPRLMSLVFSIKQTGVPLGGALAGATVPPMTLAWGWRGAALAMAAACLLTVLVIQPARRRLDADRNPNEPFLRGHPLAPLGFVLRRPDLRELALTSFIFSALQQCLAVFLVAYLTAEIGYGLVGAGRILAVALGFGIAGRVLWGWLADRQAKTDPGSSRRLLGCLSLAMAASSIAMGLWTGDWPLAAVLTVAAAYGATGAGWNGVLLAEVARRATPSEAGRATGGTLFITFFGVVVAPPAAALLTRWTGSFGTIFLVLGVLVLICAAVLLRPARA
ncbi:MAG: MFS transporter [Alphaproteobacteria bacterium]|nr:MFS transporter [Alphaproteobacteria bacterium]